MTVIAIFFIGLGALLAIFNFLVGAVVASLGVLILILKEMQKPSTDVAKGQSLSAAQPISPPLYDRVREPGDMPSRQILKKVGYDELVKTVQALGLKPDGIPPSHEEAIDLLIQYRGNDDPNEVDLGGCLGDDLDQLGYWRLLREARNMGLQVDLPGGKTISWPEAKKMIREKRLRDGP